MSTCSGLGLRFTKSFKRSLLGDAMNTVRALTFSISDACKQGSTMYTVFGRQLCFTQLCRQLCFTQLCRQLCFTQPQI
jgi:hypothetical protein